MRAVHAFVRDHGLAEADAVQLTQSRALAEYFERTARTAGNARAAGHWIVGEVARKMKGLGIDIEAFRIEPDRLGGLIALIGKGTISGSVGKEIFEKMYESGQTAEQIVDAEGLIQIDDETVLSKAVRAVLERESRPRRAVSRRQDGGARFPGRAGDEGDRREGQSKEGERASPRRTGPVEVDLWSCRAPPGG